MNIIDKIGWAVTGFVVAWAAFIVAVYSIRLIRLLKDQNKIVTSFKTQYSLMQNKLKGYDAVLLGLLIYMRNIVKDVDDPLACQLRMRYLSIAFTKYSLKIPTYCTDGKKDIMHISTSDLVKYLMEGSVDLGDFIEFLRLANDSAEKCAPPSETWEQTKGYIALAEQYYEKYRDDEDAAVENFNEVVEALRQHGMESFCKSSEEAMRSDTHSILEELDGLSPKEQFEKIIEIIDRETKSDEKARTQAVESEKPEDSSEQPGAEDPETSKEDNGIPKTRKKLQEIM